MVVVVTAAWAREEGSPERERNVKEWIPCRYLGAINGIVSPLSQISGNNGRDKTSLVCREKHDNAVISPRSPGAGPCSVSSSRKTTVVRLAREELMTTSAVLFSA